MNLYKIIFKHYAPKGSRVGIETYLIAKDEDSLFDWMVGNPKTKLREHGLSNYWGDKNDYKYDETEQCFINEFNDDDRQYWENEKGEPETYRERIKRFRGEIEDDSVEPQDLFYGDTLHGYEIVAENINSDEFVGMVRLGEVIVV